MYVLFHPLLVRKFNNTSMIIDSISPKPPTMLYKMAQIYITNYNQIVSMFFR